MSWNVKYVVLILFTTFVSYCSALLITRYEKKSSKRILPFLIPVAIFVVLVVTISILLISKKKDNNDSELVVSENSKENKYEK